jgi:transposase
MAALTVTPRRQRLGLYFRTLQDGYFQTEDIAAFLRDLHYHIRGKIIVVWDGWKPHAAAEKLVASPRMECVTLPPYAPELNPVEQLWNYLKWTKLANHACHDSDELHGELKPILWQIRLSTNRLRSFWLTAQLPL